MNTIMKYRGYTGSVEMSEEDDVLYGRVLGIKSLISYEGVTCGELRTGFHEAVDDYLLACKERGVSPEVPYKGTFNVRISPLLHERVATLAIRQGRSLNSCVQEALELFVATAVDAG